MTHIRSKVEKLSLKLINEEKGVTSSSREGLREEQVNSENKRGIIMTLLKTKCN